jgi:hypothetical protein
MKKSELKQGVLEFLVLIGIFAVAIMLAWLVYLDKIE